MKSTAKRGKSDWCSRTLPVSALLIVLAVWSGFAPGVLAEDAETGDLEVSVSGLKNDKGVLVVALLSSEAMYDSGAVVHRDESVPIRAGRARVTFEGLAYGDYAVKTFHDENANGKLDTNFVGFPKEGFGFSNNAMGRFGPPSFEQAKFSIGSAKLRIEIHSK